jgi:hypothetical protein
MLMERVAGGGDSGIAFASVQCACETHNPALESKATMIVTHALTKRYGLAEAHVWCRCQDEGELRGSILRKSRWVQSESAVRPGLAHPSLDDLKSLVP